MSPLHVEVFNSGRNKWIRVGEVQPTDPPGSMSNNKLDGSRELYQFGCAPDDSKSTIYRSGAGIDIATRRFRDAIIVPSKLEVVKVLGNGESTELNIRTDKDAEFRRIRFAHRQNKS